MIKKILNKAFIGLLLLFLHQIVWAVDIIPGSAQPGLVKKNYLPREIPTTAPVPSVKSTDQKVTPLSKEAEQIKFKLTKIILKGNHVYSNVELKTIYEKKLNTTISVLDLQNIVQDITNFYRNNGYILSRAILPPQRISAGTVEVQIIEGYIDDVSVIGTPRGAKPLIQALGDKISAARPTQVQVMERNLYIANTIPGASVKAVLEPSDTEVGASDLSLVSDVKNITASLSYDNYGTLYLGPHQYTARLGFNSIFLPGDSTNLTYLTTTHDKELRFGDISYSTFLSSNGLLLTLDANKAITYPGFLLEQLETNGIAVTYTASLQYPVIRSRSQNLVLDGNFAYLNSETKQFQEAIYTDHIRPAQIGGYWTSADSYGGSNFVTIHLMHGFNLMNASNDYNSFETSRFGADGIFTKWNATASRTQYLIGRLSAFLLAQGQYSYNPLLVEEQFGFGGSQIGRGYDPAEIIGDRGLAGSGELRFDFYPNNWALQNIQLYAYYDAGVIWNLRDIAGSVTKQSATSTGFGARFSILKYLSGNVMWTQPLTKPIAAESFIGKGKTPRIFFSITAAT